MPEKTERDTTLLDLSIAVEDFVHERDWHQFHTPVNLAQAISIEAGELLECFQWGIESDYNSVYEELADVVIYCVALANTMGIDLARVIYYKMKKNAVKYPANEWRGRAR